MKEIWKPIKDFEGLYEISNFGRVKSLNRTYKYDKLNRNSCLFQAEVFFKGRILITKSTARKYHVICAMNKGVRNYFLIHRLVGEHFIPNPENKPQINHKDCNMKNNHVTNLEWVTRKENAEHASKNKLLRSGKTHPNTKLILNTQTGVYYYGVREAAASTHFTYSTVATKLGASSKSKNNTCLIYV